MIKDEVQPDWSQGRKIKILNWVEYAIFDHLKLEIAI